MDADAPVLARTSRTRRSGMAAQSHNHISSGCGDKDLTDAAFRKAEVTVKEMISYIYRRRLPCVCSFDKIKGELTIGARFQAPHYRTGCADRQDSGAQDHVISPTSAGFRQQGRRYPGYICAGSHRRQPASR